MVHTKNSIQHPENIPLNQTTQNSLSLGKKAKFFTSFQDFINVYMLLEQPDLSCRHYVTTTCGHAPHLDASIQVVPTSLQCEMRNVVMLTFVYLRILNSIRLSTKLFINQSQPPRYTSLLVHISLGRSPHEVWMVERSTPALRLAKMEYHGSIKSTKSTCEKDNHMTTASCSMCTFSAYLTVFVSRGHPSNEV